MFGIVQDYIELCNNDFFPDLINYKIFLFIVIYVIVLQFIIYYNYN